MASFSAASAASAVSAASAAVAELALDRERAAMYAADAQSFIAQRCYYRSTQLPPMDAALADRDYTWRRAYNDRHNHWLAALDAMRAARTANRAGDAQSVHEALEEQLGPDSEAEEEAEEEAEMDSDPVVELPPERVNQLVEEVLLSMAQPTAAPHVQAFTGRFYRLDTQ